MWTINFCLALYPRICLVRTSSNPRVLPAHFQTSGGIGCWRFHWQNGENCRRKESHHHGNQEKKNGSHGPAMVCPVYAPKWLRELSSTTSPNWCDVVMPQKNQQLGMGTSRTSRSDCRFGSALELPFHLDLLRIQAQGPWNIPGWEDPVPSRVESLALVHEIQTAVLREKWQEMETH